MGVVLRGLLPGSSVRMATPKSVKFADEEPPKKPWQDSLNSSSKALTFLFSTGMLSDITFAVGSEGKQFRVHRLLLATRSPVFEELLVADPRYSSCDDVIAVRDDPVQGFKWLMEHIYSDRTDFDNMEIALQVLVLSEKYMVASAYDICVRYLRKSVKRNNVLGLYRHLIESHSDNEALFGLCRKLLAANGNAVLLSSSLLRLPPRALTSLLQEDLSVTSEVVIFKAVLSWATAQLKARGISTSSANLRREVDPFIKDIRFFTMSSDEFVQNVLVADLLTSDESVIALKHIARPGGPISTSELLNDGIKLCPSREPRTQLITKDRIRTCSCDGVQRSWLRRDNFEFHLTTSDNIILLAFKLQLKGGSFPVQVEIWKEDSPNSLLGSTECQANRASFKNPVHLRESQGYVVRLDVGTTSGHGAGGDTVPLLYGAEHNAATFSEGDVTLTLAPGVFVDAVDFV